MAGILEIAKRFLTSQTTPEPAPTYGRLRFVNQTETTSHEAPHGRVIDVDLTQSKVLVGSELHSVDGDVASTVSGAIVVSRMSSSNVRDAHDVTDIVQLTVREPDPRLSGEAEESEVQTVALDGLPEHAIKAVEEKNRDEHGLREQDLLVIADVVRLRVQDPGVVVDVVERNGAKERKIGSPEDNDSKRVVVFARKGFELH